MRIKVLYKNNVFLSKDINISESEIIETVESMFESINVMDKLKFETPDGWVILPAKILKKSIIFIE